MKKNSKDENFRFELRYYFCHLFSIQNIPPIERYFPTVYQPDKVLVLCSLQLSQLKYFIITKIEN